MSQGDGSDARPFVITLASPAARRLGVYDMRPRTGNARLDEAIVEARVAARRALDAIRDARQADTKIDRDFALRAARRWRQRASRYRAEARRIERGGR